MSEFSPLPCEFDQMPLTAVYLKNPTRKRLSPAYQILSPLNDAVCVAKGFQSLMPCIQ